MSQVTLRGHESLLSGFQQTVERGRLAHSYLFVGPPGVGKKLFAVTLAKALLCERRQAGGRLQACGACASCGMVAARTHPDLFMVGRPEESNELPIETMRDLCANFALRSARGRGKVAVLDDADDLNAASANCFLKTLEEPPPRSVFFLIGSARDRQLPTIVSRCQVVRFAPLADAVVAEILREHGTADERLLDRLLKLSGGSAGQALALADPELWGFRGLFLDHLARRPFDPVAASKLAMQHIEKAGKETALQRRWAERVVRMLVAFLRDALTYSLGGTPQMNEPEELQWLQHFTTDRVPEQFMTWVDRCLQAEIQIRRYIQIVVVMEGLLEAFGE